MAQPELNAIYQDVQQQSEMHRLAELKKEIL